LLIHKTRKRCDTPSPATLFTSYGCILPAAAQLEPRERSKLLHLLLLLLLLLLLQQLFVRLCKASNASAAVLHPLNSALDACTSSKR
jgi:hypothetical protein